jgi:hypothetical protein
MPSPERPGGPSNNQQAAVPYFEVRRFNNERRALVTYNHLQDTLLENACDLSTYRFLLNQMSHVAVLGERPAEVLVQVVERLLASGTPTTVPPEVRAALEQRRAQARAIGPWVEGHYRPGRRLPTNGNDKQNGGS